MGKILTLLTKPIKNWNIENRAFKVISQEKPTPAPRYPTEEEHLRAALRGKPDVMNVEDRKSEVLLGRLSQVYVSSQDSEIIEMSKRSKLEEETRPLPQDRHIVETSEFGYREPASVPQGKVTLRQALQLISNHQQDPERWSAKTIAKEYNLNLNLTEKVLQHFRTFEKQTVKLRKSGDPFPVPESVMKQIQSETLEKTVQTKKNVHINAEDQSLPLNVKKK